MLKNYQKATLRRIFVLATLIAGVCAITGESWATTCFLPSGKCSTSRVNDDNGGGGGGGTEPEPKPEEDKCKDFNANTTATVYDIKKSISCFSCSTCESNGSIKYRCETNSEYNWDGEHCCNPGYKWYSNGGVNGAGGCCSISNGCSCPDLQVWKNDKCECQYEKTSNGTCCAAEEIADGAICCKSGEHADNGICCPSGQYADGNICCPTNKHNVNGTCVCKENYVSDGNGGCKVKEPDIDPCSINTDCNLVGLAIGERSSIDNMSSEDSIKVKYNCTISDYEKAKNYLGNINFVIKSKLECIQQGTSSTVATPAQYYTMATIPLSNAQSSNFSGTKNLSKSDFKSKLNCGSNHTSYLGTTYEVQNNNNCASKKSCSDYRLKKSSECGTDTTFEPDSTHPTDDYDNRCGTCKPKGFTIYAEERSNGTYHCTKNYNSESTRVSMRFYLKQGLREAKDINGATVDKITSNGVTYQAGTYQVCLYRDQPGIVYIINLSIYENGSKFKCWDFPYNGSAVNEGCETSQEGVNQTSCYTATFEAGKEYRISQGWIGSGSNDRDTWKCELIPSFD